MRALCVLLLLLFGGCGPVSGVLLFLEATNDNTTPPEPLVVVQSGPVPIANEADAAFTFSTNRTDLSFAGQLKRDGVIIQAFGPITNPYVLRELADGEYEFTVRVSAGDKISEAVHRWTVDTTPPDAPTLPRITTATDTELFLAWTQGADLGSGIIGYEIHYSLDEPPAVAVPDDFKGMGGVVATLTQDSPARVGNVTLATIANLERCKRYFVGVSAIDAAGNRSTIAQTASRRTGCGGNGRFAFARTITWPEPPRAIAAGDFDGDGNVDLAAHRAFARGVGDGTFTVSGNSEIMVNHGLTPVDLNGDGALDLLAGKSYMINFGNGTFVHETGPTGPLANSVVVDLEEDGVPDLALLNDDTPGATAVARLNFSRQTLVTVDMVAIGRGAGTFQFAGAEFVPDFIDLVTADFDGDRRFDLGLVQDGRIGILLNGSFDGGDAINVGTGDLPRATLAVDLDRDGFADLAVVSGSAPSNLRIFLGNGDGTFRAPQVLPTGTLPGPLVSGDFNADAVPDLAVVCEGSSDVHVYLGEGKNGIPSGSWTRDGIYAVGTSPVDIEVADFNGDGILDLATADSGAITILEGQGAAGRGSGKLALDPEVVLETGDRPRDIIAADLNGDAIPDLAVVVEPDPGLFDELDGQPAPSIVIFQGNGIDGQGDGTYGGAQVLRMAGIDDTDLRNPAGNSGQGSYPAQSVTMSLVAADFNGDLALDLVAFKGGAGSQSPRLDLNIFDGDLAGGRPTGTFGVRRSTGSPEFREIGPSGLRAADLDRDGNMDLISLSDLRFDFKAGPSWFTDHVVSVRLGRGDGRFEAQKRSGPAESGDFVVTEFCGGGTAGAPRRRHLALGDFNADGVLDIASVDEFCPQLHIWLGNQASPGVGDGTFVEQPITGLAAGSAPTYVLVADVNRDRILDVLVAQQGSGSVRVFLGDGANGIGDGTFTAGQELATGAGAVHLAAADFNGDHEIDLAVANRTAGTVSILLGRGDGTFVLDDSYPVGTNPIATVPLDANADNVPDLAVADETDRKVRILLGVNELE